MGLGGCREVTFEKGRVGNEKLEKKKRFQLLLEKCNVFSFVK